MELNLSAKITHSLSSLFSSVVEKLFQVLYDKALCKQFVHEGYWRKQLPIKYHCFSGQPVAFGICKTICKPADKYQVQLYLSPPHDKKVSTGKRRKSTMGTPSPTSFFRYTSLAFSTIRSMSSTWWAVRTQSPSWNGIFHHFKPCLASAPMRGTPIRMLGVPRKGADTGGAKNGRINTSHPLLVPSCLTA